MSQPSASPRLLRPRRALVIATACLASSDPAPSRASVPVETSFHQVDPVTFLSAAANNIARQPSGQISSMVSTPCTKATEPATAGAAKLVPLSDNPTTETPVPFAHISGSSRSECDDAGFRNTVSPAIAAAVSSWLPTVTVLKLLWLTYSVDVPLPDAMTMVGYG